MMLLRNIAAALVLAVLVLCGKALGEETPELDAGRSLLLAAEPVHGEALSEAELHGRPLVLTFFASWCPPCTDEFDTLNLLRENYPSDKLAIVALNVFERWGGHDDPERMQRFLARTKPAFHVLMGNPEMRAVFGEVERIPTLIVFDEEGREIWRFVHEVDATKMTATLEEIEAALQQ